MSIVILGAHRSGTSMVAGILNALGYYAGGQEDLTEKGEENPAGFFERKDFREINDRVLQDNNYDWCKVAGFSIESLSSESKIEYKHSVEAIITKLDALGEWVIKEPRFCLLYPLLKEYVDSAIKVVVYREPLEAAESLWKRNGIPFVYGLSLWEKYYNELFGSIAVENLIVVNYNKLLLNPKGEVNALVNSIKKYAHVDISDADIERAASFINTEYYRSNMYSDINDQYLTEGQKKIYSQLNNYKDGGEFSQISEKVTNNILSQFQDSVVQACELDKTNKLLESTREKVSALEAQLADKEVEHNVMLAEYSNALDQVRQLLANKKSEIHLIRSSISWKLMAPLRYMSRRNPRISSFFIKFIRKSYAFVRQKYIQSRTKVERPDWKPPADMAKRVVRYRKGSSQEHNKVAIFTALYGGYDSLMLPDQLEPDIDYICYTDLPINSYGVWQIKASPYYHPDSTRMARYVKTHPHELLSDYDAVVWLDANIIIRGDIREYINILLTSQADMGLVMHPHRNCVYQEAEACKKLNKDNFDVIDQQIARYKEEGYPENSGMYETGFYIANHKTSKMKKFFRTWWKEIDLFSRRDQLSVGWALAGSGVKTARLMSEDLSVRNNPDFTIYPHEQARCLYVPKQLKRFNKVEVPAAGSTFYDVRENALLSVKNYTIDIIVCVYNALDDVKLCLASVIRYISNNQSLIIVNDVSDRETSNYLRQFAQDNENVTLIENEHNLGYTKSANRGLQASNADFMIMLNSDTIVSDNWASKLAAVAYSSDAIGIVGPLSNAAGSQSIPDIRSSAGQTAINEIPENISLMDLDAECEKWAPAAPWPRVSLVHGFCFGIKRSVIEGIGYFDDVNFDRYYGEENDYCFRARAAGFEFAIATNTFVFHRKSRSIEEEERLIYMDKAGKRLRELYGAHNVATACKQIADHPLLINMRKQASRYFRAM